MITEKNYSIIGIDPSTSHLGVVLGYINGGTLEFTPTKWVVITPTKEGEEFQGKKVVYDEFVPQSKKRTNIKAFDVAMNLGQQLKAFINENEEDFQRPDVVCCEIPKGGKGIFATDKLFLSMGFCAGFFASLFDSETKVIGLTASEVKSAATNGLDSMALKQKVIKWAVLHYPAVEWRCGTIKDPNSERVLGSFTNCPECSEFNEHIADALACVEALKRSAKFKHWLKDAPKICRYKGKKGSAIETMTSLMLELSEKEDKRLPSIEEIIKDSNAADSWKDKGFEVRYPKRISMRGLPEAEGGQAWDSSEDKWIQALVKAGYTAEVIRREFFKTGTREVIFSDKYLMRAALDDLVGKPTVKKEKKSKRAKKEHSYVKMLKLLDLYDFQDSERFFSTDYILNHMSGKEQEDQIWSKIKALEFQIGGFIYALTDKSKFWAEDEVDLGELKISKKACLYCTSALVDAYIEDLKNLRAKQNQIKNARKEEKKKA